MKGKNEHSQNHPDAGASCCVGKLSGAGAGAPRRRQRGLAIDGAAAFPALLPEAAAAAAESPKLAAGVPNGAQFCGVVVVVVGAGL